VDVSPSSGGTVKVEQAIPSLYPDTFTFRNDALVRLEAVPATGYNFNNWSGDLNSTANPITILIDCNKKITANFTQIKQTLNVQIKGSGSINPPIGNHSYADGTVVPLTATPESGWRFDKWTGDVTEPNKATTIVRMDSDKTIMANFSQGTSSWWLTGIIIAAVIIGMIVWLTTRSGKVQ
jgi:hypothetical protein